MTNNKSPSDGSLRKVFKDWFGGGYQTMIPSFYNFSVSPTWAEIQAAQVAQAAQAEEIPNAEV